MKRLILMLLVLPCVTLAIDPRLVLDPLYEPRIGDLCLIGMFDLKSKSCYDVLGVKNDFDYRSYHAILKSGDQQNLTQFLKDGYVINVTAGTQVELLKLEEFPDPDPRPDSAYVREGDRKFWIHRFALLRKVGSVIPAEPKPKQQAASLLKSAQNLEKAGKKPGALEYYRRVVKEFPETPEAKTAAERIKALEGKSQERR